MPNLLIGKMLNFSEAVPYGIGARAAFAVCRSGTGASGGVAAVGLDLFGGGHVQLAGPKNGFVLSFTVGRDVGRFGDGLPLAGLGMGLVPEALGDGERFDAVTRPPILFVADLVQVTVVTAAQRHRELVADLEADGPGLRKA